MLCVDGVLRKHDSVKAECIDVMLSEMEHVAPGSSDRWLEKAETFFEVILCFYYFFQQILL